LPTTYDTVAYPAAIFERTQPDRLAVFATLHGLTPPDPATARVLEIGCGEGLNLLAFAAAYPQAQYTGFDLAETAIAKGRELATAAGLVNVTLEVGNALDYARSIAAGSFDYVIAHGVFAWVPAEVRTAIMELIGHALSPHGVAYVSYNTLPGGYFRLAMRDMLLHEVGEIADPTAKIEAARAHLKAIADADAKGVLAAEHLKQLAADMLDRDVNVLFHDELGEVFAPQSLTAVVNAAKASGLRYLADGEHVRLYEGFLEDGELLSREPDRAVVRVAQTTDYREACMFRMSLFVRDEARPCRTIDPNMINDMWISTVLSWHEEKQKFHHSESKFLDVADDEMNVIMHRVADAQPGRIPVRGLINDEQRQRMFLKLFSIGHVGLHMNAAPFALKVGDRPKASPLIRGEIALARPVLSRLDHQLLTIDQSHVRALLNAANGQRSVDQMIADLDGIFPANEIVPALTALAKKAVMLG
jgi:SAM-dependent methyltransferase